jgi:hypothetical protein
MFSSTWIQRALRFKKTGATHRMLGIPSGHKLPFTLLERIKSADIGDVIINPTKTGKARIKVTPLLKKRAVLAYTLKRMRQ